MKIEKVKDFNSRQTNPLMVFTLGNGSMYDQPRKNGYVVSTGKSHSYLKNMKKAKDFIREYIIND